MAVPSSVTAGYRRRCRTHSSPGAAPNRRHCLSNRRQFPPVGVALDRFAFSRARAGSRAPARLSHGGKMASAPHRLVLFLRNESFADRSTCLLYKEGQPFQLEWRKRISALSTIFHNVDTALGQEYYRLLRHLGVYRCGDRSWRAGGSGSETVGRHQCAGLGGSESRGWRKCAIHGIKAPSSKATSCC